MSVGCGRNADKGDTCAGSVKSAAADGQGLAVSDLSDLSDLSNLSGPRLRALDFILFGLAGLKFREYGFRLLAESG
jgi:hypothetical protein